MAHSDGESENGPLRLIFDRRLKLEFHGSRVIVVLSPILVLEIIGPGPDLWAGAWLHPNLEVHPTDLFRRAGNSYRFGVPDFLRAQGPSPYPAVTERLETNRGAKTRPRDLRSGNLG